MTFIERRKCIRKDIEEAAVACLSFEEVLKRNVVFDPRKYKVWGEHVTVSHLEKEEISNH